MLPWKQRRAKWQTRAANWSPLLDVWFSSAKNIHDTISSEKIQQLIYKNRSIIGFNVPTLRPERIAEGVSVRMPAAIASKWVG